MIDWEDLAYATAERFGGTMPHPDTAQAIAAVYNRAPNAVLRAIDRVADDYDQGTIRSPWGVLKTRVQQITADTQHAQQGNDRDKIIARAEQWMRTAGLYLDRESELVDELFGDRGRLRDHHTPDLEQRLVALWRDLRPLGELAEHEHEQYLARYAEQRAALHPKAAAEPDNVTVAETIST